AAPGPATDQALSTQQEQRITDRAAAGLQLAGDLALHQPVAADKLAPGDQAADRVGGLHGQGLVPQRLQRVSGQRGPGTPPPRRLAGTHGAALRVSCLLILTAPQWPAR